MEKGMEERQKPIRRGLFVVVDGLDGIGKGTIEKAILHQNTLDGRFITDTANYDFFIRNWTNLFSGNMFGGENGKASHETLYTAEPSYHGIGVSIRTEMIRKNGRDYSAQEQIEAYSLDRLTQMRWMVVPTLNAGGNVIQSRCFASTLCYQSLTAEDEGKNPEEIRKRILMHRGSKYQLENRPDLLIIPTINDPAKLMERIQTRKAEGKDDDCVFENLPFQLRLKPLYESDWLRKIFRDAGSAIAYLNAGISVEESKRQAVEIYKFFLEHRDEPLQNRVQPEYSLPAFN